MEDNTNSMNPNFETNQNKRYANFKNINIKNCNSIKKNKKTKQYLLFNKTVPLFQQFFKILKKSIKCHHFFKYTINNVILHQMWYYIHWMHDRFTPNVNLLILKCGITCIRYMIDFLPMPTSQSQSQSQSQVLNHNLSL